LRLQKLVFVCLPNGLIAVASQYFGCSIGLAAGVVGGERRQHGTGFGCFRFARGMPGIVKRIPANGLADIEPRRSLAARNLSPGSRR
jgi:hypothetical protein